MINIFTTNQKTWWAVDSRNKIIDMDCNKELLKTRIRIKQWGCKSISVLGVNNQESQKRRRKMLNVMCLCGNIFIARESDIRRNHTKSCGCLKNKMK